MDPRKLEDILIEEKGSKEESRTKAVIPIHLYGQCADMAPIMDLAERYGFHVIEDGAQAIGSDYPFPSGTKRACGIGDMGVFSFYPSKNLSAYGDAGMVLTEEEGLAERLRILRVHGAKNKYFHDTIGGNFRLDAIQAGVLRVKLKYLDEWLEKRMEKASLYDKLFEQSDLTSIGFIQIPAAVYKNSGIPHYHTYHQYVIRAQSRDDLQKFLKNKGIASVVYYPLALHLQECFSHLGYKKGDFPVSEKASAEVLALPVYPELEKEQQEYVVSMVQNFYEGKEKSGS
jgi:dTDP-4-amino-4,6-dideoxygalactose transaminase